MTAAGIVRLLADIRVEPSRQNVLTVWQARIAKDAEASNGLATFKAACDDMAGRAPPGDPFRDEAKLWLWRSADNHLIGRHGIEAVEPIFYGAFPEAAPESNVELDARATKIDDRNETDAEIRRLAKLPSIEYDRERVPAAERLGIRVGVLDKAVKGTRAESGETKGQGRPFQVPETELWPDAVDGATLLAEIVNAIRRYVVLPDGAAEIIALWVLHTHCFDCFMHSPRLAITSPEKRCGKTTLLDVLAFLVARALSTSNATASTIFRVIEMARPTLLIDEADTFLKENDELRGILNSGHRKGGSVLRKIVPPGVV